MGEEVEAAAIGVLGGEACAELLQVAFEPAEFLGDVGTVGKESQFAGKALVIRGESRIEGGEPGAHGLAMFCGHRRGQLSDGGDLGGEKVEQAAQLAGQMRAFFGAHGFERTQGGVRGFGQGGRFRGRTGNRFARRCRVKPDQVRQRGRTRNFQAALHRGEFAVQAAEEIRVEKKSCVDSG